MSRPIFEVDVFDTGPFSGNLVAVVLDADGLSTEAVGRWPPSVRSLWWRKSANLQSASAPLPPRASALWRVTPRIRSRGR